MLYDKAEKRHTKNCKKFIKWLKKNNFQIYDSKTFNEFAGIFNSDIRLRPSELFIRKHLPQYSFVLICNAFPNIATFKWLEDEGAELLKQNIALVLIYSSSYNDRLSSLLKTVYVIKDENLFDQTTIEKSGVSWSKSVFEEDLHTWLNKKDEIFKQYVKK